MDETDLEKGYPSLPLNTAGADGIFYELSC